MFYTKEAVMERTYAFNDPLLNQIYPFAKRFPQKDVKVRIDGFSPKAEMILQSVLEEFGLNGRTEIVSEGDADWVVSSDTLLSLLQDWDTNYKEIEDSLAKIVTTKTPNWCVLATSIADLKEIIELCKSRPFAWDTETTDLRDLTLQVMSITVKDDGTYKNYVIPVHHKDSQLPIEKSLKAVEKILFESDKTRICHNAKFDFHVIKHNLKRMPPYFREDGSLLQHDTMLAMYSIFNRTVPLGLKPLVAAIFHDYYDDELKTYLKGIFKRQDQWDYSRIPLDVLHKYAAKDSYYCYRIMELANHAFKEIPVASKLYSQHIIPTLDSITKMEDARLCIDLDWAKNYNFTLDQYRTSLEKQILGFAVIKENFEDFNIASTKDLQRLFFDILKVKNAKKTKTGYSTDAEAMVELSKKAGDVGKIASILVSHRKAKKIQDYLNAFINNANAEKLLMPSFALHGTVSGRLASFGDFNAQNFPRSKVGVKRAIASRFGDEGCIINVDYRTLEFRIAAALSGDKKLHELLSKPDVDLHKATACFIFNKAPEDVSEEERFQAKTTNFSFIFGAGYKKIAMLAGMDQDAAKAMLKKYSETYSGLVKARELSQKKAKESGKTVTYFGRVRPFPELRNIRLNDYEQYKYLREAYSMEIQSFAVDIGFRALNLLTRLFEQKGWKSRIINQVHDSMVFDVHYDEFEEIARAIKQIMEKDAVPDIIKIPVPIELKYGPSYEDLVELDFNNYSSIGEVKLNVEKLRKKKFDDWLNLDEYIGHIISELLEAT